MCYPCRRSELSPMFPVAHSEHVASCRGGVNQLHPHPARVFDACPPPPSRGRWENAARSKRTDQTRFAMRLGKPHARVLCQNRRQGQLRKDRRGDRHLPVRGHHRGFFGQSRQRAVHGGLEIRSPHRPRRADRRLHVDLLDPDDRPVPGHRARRDAGLARLRQGAVSRTGLHQRHRHAHLHDRRGRRAEAPVARRHPGGESERRYRGGRAPYPSLGQGRGLRFFPMRLKGKVCIITGGGSGIGRASALLFAQEGARLAVADKRAASAEAVAAEAARKGAEAIAVEVDVANAAAVERMIARTLEKFGRLDVLVNNAGYGITGSVVETDAAAWDALMAVNVRGVFLCSKYAIPAMKRSGGGTIVNTASVVAAVGIANRAAYCASKGAVAALTRAIAIDHVGDGIRCNAIAPGPIDTPYFDDILRKSADAAATRKALEARQLLGRLGTPEEIAAGILFLASDESRFATGTILTLDGGMTAQ